MRRLSLLTVAPLAALLVAGAVAAQDQEPAPDDGGDGEIGARFVQPEECQAEPLAPEDVAAILGSGDGIESVTFQVPLGEFAGEESAARIRETVRGVIACLNAGDFLRGAALSTDNGARVLFGGLAANGEAALLERLAAEPVVRAEESLIRLVSITDPNVTPEGKLAAFVVINEPTRMPLGQETLLFIFAEEDGQLRFDNLVGFSIVPQELPATPTADATPAA